ncbi:MAG: AAA family ATPase [Clostridia bacterium]|nr:AAA family ATPase [Clostridia bacterium]
MKIVEINIIQFGKFKNEVFTFRDGFNIVKGDNESGKSTLLAFIKFALYGVGRKNPNVTVGERERAVSWGTGIAAGSLTIEDIDGKKYRIERAGREGARGTYADKVRIIDLESGGEVFGGEVPGEHFLGIGASAYDSMCNIKQLETVVIGADSVKGAIDNLLSSGDEGTNVQAATKMLDTERRRLMHTNGRGGLVFDSEMALERLKSEHRTALILENERIKNTDELDRVELSLAKAREEHKIAQKMCDLYDDVLRLDAFERLRGLEAERTELESALRSLNEDADFDVALASYEKIAEIKSASDGLAASEGAFKSAEAEFKNAENSLLNIDISGSEGLSSLLDEFSSPRSAGAHFATKVKRMRSSLLGTVILGALGGILAIISGAISLGMGNPSGGLTVGFIALISLLGAGAFLKKYKGARSDKQAFEKRFAGIIPKIDEYSIEEALEKFAQSRSAIVQRKNALENAKFRLSMAEDGFNSSLERARGLIKSLGAVSINGQECEILISFAEKMKNYLTEKRELEQKIREKGALCSSLKKELERFNEADIRARINPSLIEKIKAVSFEKLKAERDSALQKTNQYSQYKAGIERNLAANGQRKSANDIFPEIEAEQVRLGELKLRLDAVRLAMDTINAASLELKGDVVPRIRERAQSNLATATGGKYSELFVDENMKLSVFADGETRPIESLSRGSLDVSYFALRLAFLQVLLAEKNPPLYMDECLSQLDDSRAENVLRAIAEHSRNAQCVLFTCQKRDVELAREIGNVNLIEI